MGSVNGEPITEEQFKESYVQELIHSGDNDTEERRRQHWFDLVNQVLLAQKADSVGLKDEEFESWRRTTLGMQAIDEYLRSEIEKRRIEPTDSMLRVAYLYQNTEVRVSHLFTYRKAEADELYRRLEDGEDFRDLANEFYQTSAYDSTAGYIGKIDYFKVDDIFAKTAFSLARGEYSKPVRSEAGYHIIYMDGFTRQPIIMEEQYQQKKQTVSNLVTMRENTLQGEAFVQDLMQQHDIQLDVDHTKRLRDEMKKISDRYRLNNQKEIAKPRPVKSDIEFISEQLPQELELASYQLDGEPQIFRVRDYVKWMRYLPLSEAQNRIGASIGRAMRNEVLLHYANDGGFFDNRFVSDAMARLERNYLARRVDRYFADQPVDTAQIPEDKLKEAYRISGFGQRQLVSADYWYLPVEGLPEARELKQQIEQEGKRPEQMEGYVKHLGKQGDFEPDIKPYLMKMDTGIPQILDTSEGLYLIELLDIKTKQYSYEDRRDAVLKQMVPHMNKFLYLSKAQRGATIERNRAVFDEVISEVE